MIIVNELVIESEIYKEKRDNIYVNCMQSQLYRSKPQITIKILLSITNINKYILNNMQLV